ncbi:hypothetical protein H696_02788 [Fonticula alba]|uniref:7-dehydrocholesterol reductase n=1 Tax=Fonticula alba TaxID=691883 RepID=A0A058Z8L4_FONAL|nr:hypothetical protein H696_02788 [Fonticula alba]KCV70446.1 hypothetical protein H696_02788 [Fonticula alba]|eukprot:XP_009494962.1 hypothetical protein H696_02788 [Fonticula alba]
MSLSTLTTRPRRTGVSSPTDTPSLKSRSVETLAAPAPDAATAAASTAAAAADQPKSLFMAFYENVIHRTVAPLFLMLATLLWVPFCIHTVTQLDGSYARLIEFIASEGLVNAYRKCYVAPDATTYGILIVFSVFQLVLMFALPGRRVAGPESEGGFTPIYRANGVAAYLVTCISLVAVHFSGLFDVSRVYDQLPQIFSLTVPGIFVFCLLLYVKGALLPSNRHSSKLAPGEDNPDFGLSGNPILDFYAGTELYPYIGPLNLKFYTNCRWGMMTWPTLIIVYAIKQYTMLGHLSNPMIMSVTIQLVYLFKFFHWEMGYMATLDIMHDRLGYYICWGIFCLVPSLYTLCTNYLVNHPYEISNLTCFLGTVFGISLVALEYHIDMERVHFRNAKGKDKIWGRLPRHVVAKYIAADGTERTSLLLADGFWGLSRHINYAFEIAMTFVWTVPFQFNHIMPYSYVIFLTGLLLHRLYRDEVRCSQKYGEHYEEYRRLVPYYLIPYVF